MRSVPAPTRLTEPYWQAASQGRLVYQWCASCGNFQHLPESGCRTCGEQRDLSWREVDGRGTVDAFTVVHRTFAPGFSTRVPYVLAWVSLAVQPQLRAFGNVLDVDPADVHIGLHVESCYETIPGFGPVPNFRALSRA